MDYQDTFLHHCRKLQIMLEADQNEISSGLQEDFLIEYRKLLEKEMEALHKLMSQTKNLK